VFGAAAVVTGVGAELADLGWPGFVASVVVAGAVAFGADHAVTRLRDDIIRLDPLAELYCPAPVVGAPARNAAAAVLARVTNPPHALIVTGPLGVGLETVARFTLNRPEAADRYGARRAIVDLTGASSLDEAQQRVLRRVRDWPSGLLAVVGLAETLAGGRTTPDPFLSWLLRQASRLHVMVCVARPALDRVGAIDLPHVEVSTLSDGEVRHLFRTLAPEVDERHVPADLHALTAGLPQLVVVLAAIADRGGTSALSRVLTGAGDVPLHEHVLLDRLTSERAILGLDGRRVLARLSAVPNGLHEDEIDDVLAGISRRGALLEAVLGLGLASRSGSRLRVSRLVAAATGGDREHEDPVEVDAALTGHVGWLCGLVARDEESANASESGPGLLAAVRRGLVDDSQHELLIGWLSERSPDPMPDVLGELLAHRPPDEHADVVMRTTERLPAEAHRSQVQLLAGVLWRDGVADEVAAPVHAEIGRLLSHTDQARALHHLRIALRLYEGLGDAYHVADSLEDLGNAMIIHDPGSAERHLEDALARFRALPVTRRATSGCARCLTSLAVVEHLRDPESARRHAEEALALAESLGNELLVAGAHHALGSIAARHDPEQAMAYLSSALRTFEQDGDVGGTVETLVGLGELEVTRDPNAARSHAERALALATSVEWPAAAASALYILGLLDSRSDIDAARRRFETALGHATAAGAVLIAAACHLDLYVLARATGGTPSPEHLDAAVALTDQLDHGLARARLQYALGTLMLDTDLDQGRRQLNDALDTLERLEDVEWSARVRFALASADLEARVPHLVAAVHGFHRMAQWTMSAQAAAALARESSEPTRTAWARYAYAAAQQSPEPQFGAVVANEFGLTTADLMDLGEPDLPPDAAADGTDG
jgi:tetratricopeptide (TPR) repeat protein